MLYHRYQNWKGMDAHALWNWDDSVRDPKCQTQKPMMKLPCCVLLYSDLPLPVPLFLSSRMERFSLCLYPDNI